MIGGLVTRQTDFAYDAVGNRTQRGVVSPALTATETYSYDSLSNRLLSTAGISGGSPIQTRTLTHTDSGNRDADLAAGAVANVAYAMTYDATDRLASVSDGGVTIGEYLHNAVGQRVSKTVGGVATHYLYDLSGRLIAEADGATGATTAEYIAFEGINLAFITTTSIYWVHGDHLGTPQMLTDEFATVAWSALYSPFGLAEETSPIALAFNPRFPGQYHDRETGYYYNYFRTYDPTSGRYVESDPIGLRGGWNTYGYVGGNPVMRVDPRGLQDFDDIAGYEPTPAEVVALSLNKTYLEFNSLNLIGSDQFFHCLAACRAVKISNQSDLVREKMKQKENIDYVRWRMGIYRPDIDTEEEMQADIKRDLEVNEYGLQCPNNIPCNTRCQRFIYEMLPDSAKSASVLMELYPSEEN